MLEGKSYYKSVNLSHANISSVTDFSNMFSDFTSIESIDLSYINISTLLNMESTFYNCTN